MIMMGMVYVAQTEVMGIFEDDLTGMEVESGIGYFNGERRVSFRSFCIFFADLKPTVRGYSRNIYYYYLLLFVINYLIHFPYSC